MNLRFFAAVLAFISLSACMHWSRVESLSEIENASRVRIESDDGPPIMLEAPSESRVMEIARSVRNARVEVRRVWAWPTALIITGAVLATLFTAIVILGIAAAGIAGG